MHPLNRKILFNKARSAKRLGKSGYIVMFENKTNYHGIHISAHCNEAFRFNIRQDGFCATMDRIFKKRREIWRRRRPDRIAFITFFDDPRLTKEFHSLYYHWWTTTKWTHFCFEYVAFTL
jgi:hypothetical protein